MKKVEKMQLTKFYFLKEEAMSSDEKERKRKRPEADESEKSEEKDSDELEQPATPQKVQKTE